ncbi:MAG: TRCF domain-containing protein, partial [Chlorobiaceae bacterium]
YLTAIHERFAFYDKISKAPSENHLNAIATELRDRFGALPEEVSNLLLLAKLKLTGTALGLEKIDIQLQGTTLFLPDQDNDHLANREFLQYLFVAVQEPWMQKYKPGFKIEKKMKLALHHPSGSDTIPAKLIELYSELLKKIEEESKTQMA